MNHTNQARCRLLGWAAAALLALSAVADEPSSATARRPRIGLVLGGGGALGLAHIGVLQVLEEQRIPIDFIAGTSMGSIIGGLYAAGLSPDFIEQEMSAIDWWDVMKDKTGRQDLDFRRKQDDSRYLMDLELGLKGGRFLFPHGLATGQKLNNLIEQYTLNAAAVERFDNLNIPFRCVATDLRSGKAVVLDEGNLATAIRASMAIPGAFTPVKMDDRILIDGGWSDNVPVDVVKAMGADIVIAVDVGYMLAEAGKTNTFDTLGQILSRTYDIMQRPNSDPQTRKADVAILPELQDYSASDFPKVAELTVKGEEAARAKADVLSKLALPADEYERWRNQQRRRRHDQAIIVDIRVEGNQRVSTNVIRHRVQTRPGQPADFDVISRDVGRIYGMGDFETVNYQLRLREENRYDLVVNANEKYWGPGYVHFGLRLDSDFEGSSFWALLLNYTRRPINRWDGEISVDIKGGQDRLFELEWYQPLREKGLVFIAPAVRENKRREGVYQDDTRVAEFTRTETSGQLDLGLEFQQYGEVKAGVYRGDLGARVETGSANLTNVDNNVGAWTVNLTLDRLDDRAFYRKGYYLNLDGFFARTDLGSFRNYDKISASFRGAFTMGAHTLQVGLQAGHSLGTEVPLYDQFVTGGMTTLIGLSPDQLRGRYFGVGRLNYLYQIGRISPTLGEGVYLMLIGDIGNAWQEEDDAGFNDLMLGMGGGIAIDTVLGPVIVAGGKAEGNSPHFYLNLGYVF